jgi:hypothetical protein
MSNLHALYLESIFGIKIGSLNHGAAEFEGHITNEDITRLCEQGLVFRQNVAAPVGEINYLNVYVEEGKVNIAIDPSTNTIVVDIERKEV